MMVATNFSCFEVTTCKLMTRLDEFLYFKNMTHKTVFENAQSTLSYLAMFIS